MPKRGGKMRQSRKIALSGVLCALAVVVMALGGVIPVAVFTAPALAGICLLPIALEIGEKTAWVAYVAASILSFLVVADYELVFLFVFILGYYPVLYARLSKIPNKVPQYCAKLLVFNAGIVAAYAVLLFVLASPALVEEFSAYAPWLWGVVLLIGNLTFILYDVLLGRLRLLYILRFKGRLFK